MWLLQCERTTTSGRNTTLTELVDDDFFRDGRSPAAYLIVVAASEEPLYHYLKARFEADASTRVVLDRRRRETPPGSADRPTTERRASPTAGIRSSQRVAVIRLTGAAGVTGPIVQEEPAGNTEERESMEGLEDRQRVDRWLEESQYLIGRMIPAYLDDRDRVRGRLDAAEQDNERLRTEVAEARREISDLRAQLEFLRSERSSVAESFNTVVEHLTALQKPINDISRHLHSAQPLGSEVPA